MDYFALDEYDDKQGREQRRKRGKGEGEAIQCLSIEWRRVGLLGARRITKRGWEENDDGEEES